MQGKANKAFKVNYKKSLLIKDNKRLKDYVG